MDQKHNLQARTHPQFASDIVPPSSRRLDIYWGKMWPPASKSDNLSGHLRSPHFPIIRRQDQTQPGC